MESQVIQLQFYPSLSPAYVSNLSLIDLELEVSQDGKDNDGESTTQPHSQVRMRSSFRNRTDVPNLGHTENSTNPTDDEACKSSETNWKIVLVLPGSPV